MSDPKLKSTAIVMLGAALIAVPDAHADVTDTRTSVNGQPVKINSTYRMPDGISRTSCGGPAGETNISADNGSSMSIKEPSPPTTASAEQVLKVMIIDSSKNQWYEFYVGPPPNSAAAQSVANAAVPGDAQVVWMTQNNSVTQHPAYQVTGHVSPIKAPNTPTPTGPAVPFEFDALCS